MEYRKKNLKPKKNLEKMLKDSLHKDEFTHKLEIFCQLRKQIFINQNELGIKAVKPCTINTEGLRKYLNDQLNNFLKVCYKSAGKDQQHSLRKLIYNLEKLDTDGRGELQQKVIESLMAKFQNSSDAKFQQQDLDKVKDLSQCINVNELKQRKEHKLQHNQNTTPATSVMNASNVKKEPAQSYTSNQIQRAGKIQLRPMHNEGGAESVISQDLSVLSNIQSHSGKHTPIVSRNRGDTQLTKDSSNDEPELKLDVRSPTRQEPGTFASHALIQHKLEMIQNNHQLKKQQMKDVERLMKLEKIVSQGAQEDDSNQVSPSKLTLQSNQREGIINETFDLYSESYQNYQIQSMTQLSQSQSSAVSPSKNNENLEEMKESNFNISQSDMNEQQYHQYNGVNMSALKKSITQVTLEYHDDFNATQDTEQMVRNQALAQPALQKQTSHPYPIIRNQVYSIS